MHAGSFFGELEVLRDRKARGSSVVAVGAVVVYRMEPNAFTKCESSAGLISTRFASGLCYLHRFLQSSAGRG